MAEQDTRDLIRDQVAAIYLSDSRRILATLVRLLGDFDAAEEALHDAFASAIEKWPAAGIPQKPVPWLISAGRFKAIDRIRRGSRHDHIELPDPEPIDEDGIEDDRLRLIFTCCHPALSMEAKVALTLREVCDLKTEEIAHAFLTPPSTLAQRIVRAKAKIRDAKIPYQIPSRDDMPERLAAVLQVIYLVFNEGYSASSGGTLVRHDLSTEAIALCRLLAELLPEPEVHGLLALMLLQDSRREARIGIDGALVLLEDQDRTRWNHAQIEEGQQLVVKALTSRRFGPYTLQAAIAAVHAEATSAATTDWAQIVGLYDVLLKTEPSDVIELNRAVALAMRDGPEAGLKITDRLLLRGELDEYYPAHAARADLCRRSGKLEQAAASYTRAIALAQSQPVREFLQRRLDALAQ